MATQTIREIFLLFHLSGFALLAGTFVADVVTLNHFWKQYYQDKYNAIAILPAMAKFPRLMGIGFGIIILSGVGMMAMTHGVFGEQLWFRIKFALVITILILRLVNGKQRIVLRKEVANKVETPGKLKKLKSRLDISNGFQLVLFLTIILLSVFKFN